jgi:hypothetical protein
MSDSPSQCFEVTIRLVVQAQSPADVDEAVERALDSGALQTEILESGLDCSVTSAAHARLAVLSTDPSIPPHDLGPGRRELLCRDVARFAAAQSGSAFGEEWLQECFRRASIAMHQMARRDPTDGEISLVGDILRAESAEREAYAERVAEGPPAYG